MASAERFIPAAEPSSNPARKRERSTNRPSAPSFLLVLLGAAFGPPALSVGVTRRGLRPACAFCWCYSARPSARLRLTPVRRYRRLILTVSSEAFFPFLQKS